MKMRQRRKLRQLSRRLVRLQQRIDMLSDELEQDNAPELDKDVIEVLDGMSYALTDGCEKLDDLLP